MSKRVVAQICALIFTTIAIVACGNDEEESGEVGGWEMQANVLSASFTRIRYADGLWVAVGGVDSRNSAIFTSTDMESWETRVTALYGQLLDIHYANGLWVVVGGGHASVRGDVTEGDEYRVVGVIFTSTDGETWVERAEVPSATFASIHYANGLWVAVGGESVLEEEGGGIGSPE